MKLLHAYVQYVYIVYTKYQITPSKAVVEVDRPIKALSLHMQKPLRITKGNNSHSGGGILISILSKWLIVNCYKMVSYH